jgi:hypothetical protein
MSSNRGTPYAVKRCGSAFKLQIAHIEYIRITSKHGCVCVVLVTRQWDVHFAW